MTRAVTDYVSRLRDTGLVIEGPERQRIADAIEALIDAVRTSLCPHPVNTRREDEIVSAEDCFCAGECGCNNGIALQKASHWAIGETVLHKCLDCGKPIESYGRCYECSEKR